jgi:hypothetical protein
LESALAEVAADQTPSGQRRPSTRNLKLEGWLQVLQQLGIDPQWHEVIDELRSWRSVRNAYAHELHLGERPRMMRPVEDWDIHRIIELVEEALNLLDRALCTR